MLCAWVFFTQRGQIYFPTPVSAAPGAQVLWVESQGERITVWTQPRPGGRALLYFGGNAEDVAGNVELFAQAFPDRSLYFVNYRGYGGSSGRPSESGLVAPPLAVAFPIGEVLWLVTFWPAVFLLAAGIVQVRGEK